MRYWVGGLIAFVLALVQASSVQQFHILGVVPNLLLVLLTAWLVVRGLDDVLPMIGVAGISLGLIGLQAPGLVLLALLPLAGLGVIRELRVVHSDFLLFLVLVAAATVFYESVMVLGVMLAGGGHDLVAAFTRDMVPATAVNVAIAPPVYLVMRLARPYPRGRRLSY